MPQPTLKAFAEEKKLADYCRTGTYTRIQGIVPGRVQYYKSLVWNVIDDSLATAFPLTKQLLTQKEWDDCVRLFFSTHYCNAYQVWKMPYEFYTFLAREPHVLKEKYPFLISLLQFEWKEIEMFMMEDRPALEYTNQGHLLIDALVLNPELEIIRLDYPVHIKQPSDILENDKAEYYVLIFRKPDTSDIEFVELSPIFVWLIENIIHNQHSAYRLAQEAANLFGYSQEDLIHHFIIFLSQMQKQKLILGFKK